MTDFEKWQIAEARCEDLRKRCEQAQANMRERAAKAIDQHLSPQSEPIYKRIAELPDVVRALPLEDVDE